MIARDTVYDCRNARFDGSAVGLTEDQMFKAAPSIFAAEAHESRSERFRPIATIDVVRQMEKEGFSPVAVQQNKSRDASKFNFTKHLIRFRRLNDGKSYKVGDTVHELIMKNANDGSACYELFSGLYRIRCSNSLVTLSEMLEMLKVYHKGQDIANRVIEGSFTVVNNSEKALAAPDEWSKLKLTRDGANVLAQAAHQIRFEDAEGNVKTQIKPEQLLIPRRPDDTNPDLWTTWNVIQENCIKGDLHATGISAKTGKMRQFGTKGIKAIDQNVRVNAALYQMGERMASILKNA